MEVKGHPETLPIASSSHQLVQPPIMSERGGEREGEEEEVGKEEEEEEEAEREEKDPRESIFLQTASFLLDVHALKVRKTEIDRERERVMTI